MKLWEISTETIGVGEGEDGVFPPEVATVAATSEAVQTDRCIRQSAQTAAKNARYLLGQPAQSPFFAANVLKRGIETRAGRVLEAEVQGTSRPNMGNNLIP